MYIAISDFFDGRPLFLVKPKNLLPQADIKLNSNNEFLDSEQENKCKESLNVLRKLFYDQDYDFKTEEKEKSRSIIDFSFENGKICIYNTMSMLHIKLLLSIHDMDHDVADFPSKCEYYWAEIDELSATEKNIVNKLDHCYAAHEDITKSYDKIPQLNLNCAKIFILKGEIVIDGSASFQISEDGASLNINGVKFTTEKSFIIRQIKKDGKNSLIISSD